MVLAQKTQVKPLARLFAYSGAGVSPAAFSL